MKPIFSKGSQLSELFILIKGIWEEDHKGYFNSFRMLPKQFDLNNLVKPLTQKLNKNLDSISTDERLALTLPYLASGDSPRSLSFNHRVSLISAHTVQKSSIQ